MVKGCRMYVLGKMGYCRRQQSQGVCQRVSLFPVLGFIGFGLQSFSFPLKP